MPRIFVSYRRSDSELITDRIYERLVEDFGDKDVFLDVEPGNIPAGADFRKVLQDAVAQCNVILIVIGPNWLNIKENNDPNLRRLDNENDFVRIEVKTGLEREQRDQILVIPVLVGGAQMPSDKELPEALKELAFRNARVVRRNPDFDLDMKRLIDRIKDYSGPTQHKTTKRLPRAFQVTGAAFGILILVLLILVASNVIRLNSTPEPTLDDRSLAMTVVAQNQIADLEVNKTMTFAAIMTSFVTETSSAISAYVTATVDNYTDIPTSPATSAQTPTEDFTATANAQITLDIQGTLSVPTNTPRPTTIPLPTATSTNTPTPTSTINVPATSTAQAIQREQAQRNAQATLDAQTTLTAEALALLLPDQNTNLDVYGRALPEDAAPYEMQVWTEMCRNDTPQTAFMAATTVYERICQPGASDLFGDSLVNFDQNLNLIPAAAESWEPSENGLTWTFHLRPGQVWSDGTPLTANDWVATYHWMAAPENAYDFAWLWQGIIQNWNEAIAGEVPPENIGMMAIDDNTLIVTTAGPIPYLPATLFFWPPLQAKALAEYGPNYQLDPATSVSFGPFILKEFTPGESILLEANPTYTGFRKPYLRQIRGIYGDKLNGSFLAFQNQEIDRVSYEFLTPADLERIKNDPVLLENYLPNPGDFRTDYLLMDTYTAPFDNVKVRQAFAKAVDREAIVSNIINANFNLALPAYSFLMPGFPASDVNGDLRTFQVYDCNLAQLRLAEAGYPNGVGFPALELKLRGESDSNAQRFIAAAASISECLNVDITVKNIEFATYMEALLGRPTGMQFGAISYGVDYIDPANLLGVWVSTGRHSWHNAAFDQLIQDAGIFLGDPEARFQMYRDAERILVEDVGGIFLDHRIQGDLFQPYIAGDCFRPNAQGVSGWQWGNDWCWGSIYITNDVVNFDTFG